jgi:hypothetical protein
VNFRYSPESSALPIEHLHCFQPFYLYLKSLELSVSSSNSFGEGNIFIFLISKLLLLQSVEFDNHRIFRSKE